MAFQYRKKRDGTGCISKTWKFMEEEFDNKNKKTGRVKLVFLL